MPEGGWSCAALSGSQYGLPLGGGAEKVQPSREGQREGGQGEGETGEGEGGLAEPGRKSR